MTETLDTNRKGGSTALPNTVVSPADPMTGLSQLQKVSTDNNQKGSEGDTSGGQYSIGDHVTSFASSGGNDTPEKLSVDGKLTIKQRNAINDSNRKANFWGVGGIMTDFVSNPDPEKAFQGLLIDCLLYLPNNFVKLLEAESVKQENRLALMKDAVREERAKYFSDRANMAKMLGYSDEQVTDHIHQDFIKAGGNMDQMAINMMKEDPSLANKLGVSNFRPDMKIQDLHLSDKQKEDLQKWSLAKRSAEIYGSAPKVFEVDEYVKQSNTFMKSGLYALMHAKQVRDQRQTAEQERISAEQKARNERITQLNTYSNQHGLSDRQIDLTIHQDFLRANGDGEKLKETLAEGKENGDMGKVLERLNSLRPEKDGPQLSEQEKLAKEEGDKKIVDKLIQEHPHLAKILPSLAEKVKQMPREKDQSGNPVSALDSKEMTEIAEQLVLAKRFNYVYGVPAEDIDMQNMTASRDAYRQEDRYAKINQGTKWEGVMKEPTVKQQQAQIMEALKSIAPQQNNNAPNPPSVPQQPGASQEEQQQNQVNPDPKREASRLDQAQQNLNQNENPVTLVMSQQELQTLKEALDIKAAQINAARAMINNAINRGKQPEQAGKAQQPIQQQKGQEHT